MDEIRVAPVIKPKITFKYSRLYLSVRYNLAQVFVEPLFIGISNVHHDHWAPWKEPIDEIEGIVEFPVGYYDLPDGQEYRIDIVDFIGNPVTWSPTISIAVPPYSELAYTEAPNDEIKRLEDLFEEFNRLVEELKDAHNALEKLPSVQEAQFWLKIASLFETFAKLPLEVWIAFWKFLRCDDSGLVELAVDNLKEMLDMLFATAQLELEFADKETKKILNAWINELETRLRLWNSEQSIEEAAKVLTNLKNLLMTNWKEVLDLLLIYFGDDIKRLLDEWLEKKELLFWREAMKFVALKIIKRRLIKKVEKELAEKIVKNLIPYINLALKLAELAAMGIIIAKIAELEDLIDEMLLKIIQGLVERGHGWPTDHEYVYFRGDHHIDAHVIIRPYVRCARKDEENNLVWGDPCSVKLTDGEKEKEARLTRINARLQEEEDGSHRWDIDIGIDMEDVENSECFKKAVICYLYYEVKIVHSDGSTNITRLIAGAKSIQF